MRKVMSFILAFVLCTLALLSQGSSQAAQAGGVPHEENFRDREYKLFYGEWVITKVVDKNLRRFDIDDEEPEREAQDKEAERLIGQVVYYDHDVFKFNGKIVANPVNYEIAILPIIDSPYAEYMKTPAELGIAGDYFVFVSVSTKGALDGFFSAIGTEFYVKDDDTLIVLEGLYCYEMKRKTHIEGYRCEYRLT